MAIDFRCPHCGVQTTFDEQFAGQSGPCRQCGQMITIPHTRPPGAYRGSGCPRCGGQSLRPGPWPWYLGTIGAMFVHAVVCNQCGHEFDARKPQADFGKRKMILALLINGFGALGIIAVFVLLAVFTYVTFNP